MRSTAVLASALIALLPSGASAHEAGLLAPDELNSWRSLLPEPLAFGVVVVLLAAYGRGSSKVPVPASRSVAFVAGLVALLIAVSPAFESIAYALLSGHMLQHLVLLVVSAPLVAYSRPVAPLLLGMPARVRRAVTPALLRHTLKHVGGHFVYPAGALLLASAVLWLWHAPVLYQAALHNPWVHTLEHALFLGTGVLFWAALLPATRRARARSGAGLLALFAMSVQGAMLGALLTFSSRLWFEHYAATAPAWGVTGVDDQLIAGLLMWMVGGLVYAAAAAVLLGLSFSAMEDRLQQAEDRVPYLAHGRREGTHEV